MEFLRRLKSADEERLIAGDAPEGGDHAEVAAFLRALRASASSQPVPPASAAFIARLAETARESAATTQEEPRATVVLRPLSRPARPRPRLALVARVAVAVATVPFLFAGLAFAGVHLPGPADDAFESLGVELPNQAADEDDDTEGTAKDGDSAGSETGQKNSAGKLGHGKAKAKQGKALGHDKAKDNQGKALGKEGLAPGQLKDKGSLGGGGNAGANSNAGGNSGASSGGGGGSGKSSGGSGGAPGVSQGGGPPPGRGPSK